jgi:hypothetical protein
MAAISVHLLYIPNRLKTSIHYDVKSSAVIYFRAPAKWSQFQLIWLISAVLFCRYNGQGNNLRIIYLYRVSAA